MSRSLGPIDDAGQNCGRAAFFAATHRGEMRVMRRAADSLRYDALS